MPPASPVPSLPNRRGSLLLQLPLVAVMLAAVFAVEVGVIALTDSSLAGILAGYLLLVGVVWLMLAGPANPSNVNDNTSGVITLMETALSLLAPGGILAVITFHSLEDRIVKQLFRAHEGREVSLPQGGSRYEGVPPRVTRLHRHAIAPTPEECAANPRARSAKLRAVRRCVP